LDKFKKGNKVIWFGEVVIISSKNPSLLAFNNGIGYKIKLSNGKNIWVSENQLKLKEL
jgi:hypothetical protein